MIPKEIRTAHGLVAGSRLTLVDEDDRLVLVPLTSQPRLVERNGLLVVTGVGGAEIPDHRALREERIAGLGLPR